MQQRIRSWEEVLLMAELMNVGVNYLREHIPEGVRLHYAYIDAGGESANVG